MFFCECELSLKGKNVKDCVEAIQGEPTNLDNGYRLDFDKIVPMPAILKGTLPSWTNDRFDLLARGLALLDDGKGLEMLSELSIKNLGITDLEGLRKYLREQPNASEYEKAGRLAMQAKEETGYYHWYAWCAGTLEKDFEDAHWGADWSALYCSKVEDSPTIIMIKFETLTWSSSPPTPIAKGLAKQYPEVTITLGYWKGSSNYRGTFVAKGEKVLKDARYEYHGPRGG